MASLQPVDCENLNFVSPAFPLFVVIIITPAAAREPYIAAAEAPFNISILAISSGLISAIRLVGLSWLEELPPAEAAETVFKPAAIDELSTYTPSII